MRKEYYVLTPTGRTPVSRVGDDDRLVARAKARDFAEKRLSGAKVRVVERVIDTFDVDETDADLAEELRRPDQRPLKERLAERVKKRPRLDHPGPRRAR